MLCEIDGCDKPVLARNWCSQHYNRWRRTGEPDFDYAWERFWSKVDATGDCWQWIASTGRGGYGRFADGGHIYAHRWVWERLIGPIPDGETVDHLCKNTGCVNPDHLEIVSLEENLARGEAPPARNGRKLYCVHGHRLDASNTYTDPNSGKRSCRACNRAKSRRWRQRNPL